MSFLRNVKDDFNHIIVDKFWNNIKYNYNFAQHTVSKNQFRKQWLYNKYTQFHAFDASQLGDVVKQVGPLIVQYIIPFVKNLIDSQSKLKFLH